MAGDEHVIGVRLGDARRDGADAGLGDELHAHTRGWIHLLEIVNQLRQILDRIDVMMRRRRDERNADDGVPQPRDQVGHLVAGQLAAFAGLRALRDFDLELVGPNEVRGGHAEAAGRDLFDPIVGAVAVCARDIGGRILTAFARIGAGVHPVHRDGECRMRFGRQRAERHRARNEAATNFLGRLDFVEWHGCLRTEVEQIPWAGSRARPGAIREGGVLAILERPHQRRRPAVILAVAAVANASVVGERARRLVTRQHVLRDLPEADPTDHRRGAGEAAVDHFRTETDRFENLRAGVGLERRDSHLGENLEQPFFGGAAVFLR